MTLKRVRDFALYSAIALAFCLSIIWYSFTNNEGGAELIGKWVGLSGTTAILFGYAIKSHRHCISLPSFWLIIMMLLAVHLSLFVVILVNVDNWKVFWFVLAYPVENVIIDTTLSVTGHGISRNKR